MGQREERETDVWMRNWINPDDKSFESTDLAMSCCIISSIITSVNLFPLTADGKVYQNRLLKGLKTFYGK